jgi:2-keto-4-pentenoate hydratase/2-oxohepta-3-ene-1,7-dioic acid hydratase in catechol pathway
MLLARIRRNPNQAPEVVAMVDGRLAPLPAFADVATLLAAGEKGLAEARAAAESAIRRGEGLAPDAVEYLPPVTPQVFLGLGYNYKALATKEGVPFNKHPEVFAKLPGCATGHGQPVRVPSVIDKIDYEAELGVVIGRRASRVKAKDALSYVGGYTPCNDLTAKLIPRPQESGSVIVPLKCADTFGPLGPVVVTSDEIADPQKLTMISRVNGVEKQRFTTDDMVHSVAETIEYITARITLNPGDVITTGTSLGIGIIKIPPEFLKNNDLVEIEIEGYPALRNRIEWEAA